MAIDYTKVDQDSVRTELLNLMKQTDSFKDANFGGTVLFDFANVLSYNASLYGFYLNQIANEPFLDTARQYKNINRIAKSLSYNPVGKGSARVPVASALSKEYVLKNAEGFIEIPVYSQFPSSELTQAGQAFSFVNNRPFVAQVKQFGVSALSENDIFYTGEVRTGGALDTNKIVIKGQSKRPIQIVDGTDVLVVEENINSRQHSSLTTFVVGTNYSLLLEQDTDVGYVLVIKPETTTVASTEIARFRVNADRTITFKQNFSVNKVYLGILGMRNLLTTRFETVSLFGKPNSVGRINLVVPQYAPAFEVLSRGEIYSFSSKDEDVVITTGDIQDGFFSSGEDINIVLSITDANKKWYASELVLKTDANLQTDDTVIGVISNNTTNVTNGNLNIPTESFLTNDSKSGKVFFADGEVTKRVIFDESYNFGLDTETIPLNNPKNYAIFLYVNESIQTYYSDKTTKGFKIHLEEDRGFEGEVFWTAVEYESEVIDNVLVDVSDKQNSFNSTVDYSVLLQPSYNVNTWATDINEDGFKINSQVSFVGQIDYLIIPEKNFSLVGNADLSGQQYVSKNQTFISVEFDKERTSTDYTLFLTPNSNVKVWWENKSSTGFTLRIEPETDFYGIVSWQLFESPLGGTINFGGGVGDTLEPDISFTDIVETSFLGFVEQGLPKMTLVYDTGLLNTGVNGLQMDYDTDITVNPGLSFEVLDTTISYNNIRVFVKTNNTWVEWTELQDFKGVVEPTSTVFTVRVNKDQHIGIKFGNDDVRGKSPIGSDIAIIGLSCVGENGNIGTNILRPEIVGSLNFETANIVTSDVQESLLDLIKIKKDAFFSGAENASLTDYLGNSVSLDDISVVQLDVGTFGTEPEGVESIRSNAQLAKLAQGRVVTTDDYQTIILNEFSDIILDLEVYNYKEAQDAGLLSSDEVAEYFYNSLFFMMVPSVGETFNIIQRDVIKTYINDKVRKHTGIEAVILEPTFVEIDVIIAYKVKTGESAIEARNAITSGVFEFFQRVNRSLGETIVLDDIRGAIDTTTISSLDLQLKRDDNREFLPEDYDVSISPESFEDSFEEVEKQKLNEEVKKQLRNLIGKGLVEIKQPLFDVQQPDGTRNWLFSGNVDLGRFEFPKLGDLVIERRT